MSKPADCTPTDAEMAAALRFANEHPAAYAALKRNGLSIAQLAKHGADALATIAERAATDGR